MLYEAYERRVKKIIAIKNKIYQYRILLIIISAVIIFLSVGFTSTKGIIYDIKLPEAFVYGEDIDINANALFTGVEYQYSLYGIEEWSQEKPRQPGKYQAKISSSKAFGKSNNEIRDFIIEPKHIDVSIKDVAIEFGNKLTVNADLIDGDYISEVSFKFEDLTKSKTSVVVETIKVLDKNNNDVTTCYKTDFIISNIDFKPRIIEILILDKESIYNSVTLTSKDFEISGGSLASGNTIEITTSGSQTEVGSSINNILYTTIRDGEIDVTNNYKITYKTGTLAVTPRPITIKPVDVTKVYDGTPLTSLAGVSVNNGDLIAGHVIKITPSGSQTNVGSGISSILQASIWDGEVEVTNNYKITIETGCLTVTPRPITIKPIDVTKVYDGTALMSNVGKSVNADDLISEHTISITTSGSQIGVGSSESSIIRASIWDHDIEVTANYEITSETGSLGVTPRPITIKPVDVTKAYDGSPLTSNSGESLNKEDLVYGHVIKLETSGSQTEVNISENEISNATIWDDEIEVTKNYSITCLKGELKVTPRLITIKPINVAKVYDGTPLTTNIGETISETKLVSGHILKLETKGNQITIGDSKNTIIHASIWNDETEVTNNYFISYEVGNLTVTHRLIIIKPIDVTKVYDGTALTSAMGKSENEDDLVSGHNIYLITVGEQTNAGSSENIISNVTILDGEIDVTGNYLITKKTGTLQVTPRFITVEPVSDSKVYDGTPLLNINFNVTKGDIVEGQITSVTSYNTITDVGKIDNSLKIEIYDKDNKVVNDNYEIDYKIGVLEVTHRLIKIKSLDALKVYDGMPLSNRNYTINDGSLADGHTISVIDYISITNASEAKNQLDLIINDIDNIEVTRNYIIDFIAGTLKVNPRPITIKPIDVSKIYDGTRLISDSSMSVNEDDLVIGHKINITTEGEQTKAGSSENVIVSVSIWDDSIEVTDNYSIKCIEGKLIVTPRPIKIKPVDVTKVYDGTPLISVKGISVDEDDLLLGHIIKITPSGSQIEAGLGESEVVAATIWDKDGEVTDNYKLSYIKGVLEVTPRPITIKPVDVTKVYDGTALTSVKGMSENDGDLLLGHTISLTTLGSQTNVGSSENKINIVKLFDELGEVTNNYLITIKLGTLTVTLRPITIRSVDDTKVYDGTPLMNIDYKIVDGSIVENQSITIDNNSNLIEVGECDNRFTIDIYDIDNSKVTANYEITYSYGSLQVTPRPILITPVDDERVYNGTPLFNLNYNITNGSLVDGQSIEVISFTQITTVGACENKLEILIYDENNIDVSLNYQIAYETGTLVILSRKITIKSKDASKTYDGTLLYNLNYEIVAGSVADEQIIIITSFASITDVGSCDNDLGILVFDDNVDVSNNYTISYQYGTLAVTKRPITIKPVNISKVYDAKPLTSILVESVNETDLVWGHVIEIETTGSQTNVGISNNTITKTTIWAEGADLTSNYEITCVDGTLEITPRPIIIKPVDDTKVYDAKPLTSNLAEWANIDDLILGHLIEIETLGSQTNVGISNNTITKVTIWDEGADVTFNYDITKVDGSLEIKKRPITIQTANDNKVYDETPLFNLNYDITVGTLVEGQRLDTENYATIIDVGKANNDLNMNIYDIENIDVTYNYDITYITGILEINPRPITIQTADDAKVYDKTKLFNLNYDIIAGSLVKDQIIDIYGYAVIVDAGKRNNRLDMMIYDINNNDVTKNYTITFLLGKLEIIPRPITIQTASDAKIYDGEPLSNTGYEITSGSLVEGQWINLNSYTSIVDAGTALNNLGLDIYDNDVDVTGNYDITVELGTLTVSHRLITIKTADDNKVYDAKALYNLNYIITFGTLVEGHEIDVINYTSITNVGVLPNQLEFEIYDLNEKIVTRNYQIHYENGFLEVIRRPIIIQTVSDDKVYDGSSLSNGNYNITEGTLANGQSIIVNFIPDITNVGTQVNNSGILIEDGNGDVTSNYDITYDFGTLVITPRPITIKTKDDAKAYDGTPLSNLENTVSEGTLVEGHIIEVDNYAFITNVGLTSNDLDMSIYDLNNTNISYNYDITYEVGTLEVTPLIIEVSTANAEKVYDGTPLERKEWSLSDGKLINNHDLNVVVTGTITNVGLTFNEFEANIIDKDLNDVTNNYIIIENLGMLEVVDATELIKIIITSGSDSKDYDGLPLEFDEWDLSFGKLLINHQLKVVVNGSITEVGVVNNDFTYEILDEEGNDVQYLYSVTSNFGKLKIVDSSNSDNGGNDADDFSIRDRGELLGEGEMPEKVMFKVYSDISGTLYMRDKSYGDYNKINWLKPTLFNAMNGVSPLNLSSLALESANKQSHELKVKAIAEDLSYYMPYYAVDGYYGASNDVYVNHKYGLGYSVNYIPYSYSDTDGITLNNTQYHDFELEYRQFVHDNYLDLPYSTRAALLELAMKNGIKQDSATLIKDIQNYIVGAGMYNMKYKPYPLNSDFAIHFLSYANEGICQHFATAGVVMYRAMGIPARYVTGYVAETIANEWNDVTELKGHAWVEIYIDGFGWVPIEVTAGGAGGTGTGPGGGIPGGDGTGGDGTGGDGTGGDGTGGDGTGDGQNEEKPLPTIEITSGNASKKYDGTPLTNFYYEISGTLKLGHEVIVNINTEITQVGVVENKFTSIILDTNGEDVSAEYNIREIYGTLVIVTNDEKTLIEFQVYNLKKVYDGTVLEHEDDDYWIPTNNLPSNYTVNIDIIGSIKEVGFKRTYIDKTTLRIYDENGYDVTNKFSIVCYFGSIEILKREITITSFSAQKEYDGTPLTLDLYIISKGSVAKNEIITVEISGSNSMIGEEPNTIKSVKITDRSGQDVTKNYIVTKDPGKLIITDES